MRRILIALAVILGVYLFGYAVLRWRKVLVLHETDIKGTMTAVRWIGPGQDVRDDWRGNVKNAIAGPAVLVFWPAGWLETEVRGRTRALP